MKVMLEIETVNEDGEKSLSKNEACLEIVEDGKAYRVMYSENIYEDEAAPSESELVISENNMRMIRRGSVASNFLYEKGTFHQSMYETQYGSFPIAVETTYYEMKKVADCHIEARATYKLITQPDSQMLMDVIIRLRPV